MNAQEIITLAIVTVAMGRWKAPLGWYPPLNQTHAPNLPVRTFGTYSTAATDDRNAAAVLQRGANTSLNHYTGANFINLPHVRTYGRTQPFFPLPRWHPTTHHIRHEHTWRRPPVPCASGTHDYCRCG